jgi:hypothetical protein
VVGSRSLALLRCGLVDEAGVSVVVVVVGGHVADCVSQFGQVGRPVNQRLVQVLNLVPVVGHVSQGRVLIHSAEDGISIHFLFVEWEDATHRGVVVAVHRGEFVDGLAVLEGQQDSLRAESGGDAVRGDTLIRERLDEGQLLGGDGVRHDVSFGLCGAAVPPSYIKYDTRREWLQVLRGSF